MALELELAGRHVFVFGGTSGINLGIAGAFVREGAKVTVASRKRENVDAALEHLRKIAPHVHGCCADVRDPEAIRAALDDAVARFGPLHTIISGAAGNFLCEAEKISPNGFKTVVDIDLLGTFNAVRLGFDYLAKPGANIISITAPQSTVPMRFQAHAAAAKAGVDQLTRVLALEWGRHGVRVNAISPGPIDGTEGFTRLIGPDPAARQKAIDWVPLRRLGSLQDIADLALFLASPRASYISGAIIPCDGGGAIESCKPALEAAAQAQR